MRFEYIGDLPIKDVDLVLSGIFTPNQSIIKGTEFEVPDDDILLIQRVKLNGIYKELPKAVKPKKTSKKKKEEKEEK